MGLSKKTSDEVLRRTGTRPKMDLYDRAKIFIPFDPLKGFAEALRAKEAEVEREKDVLPGKSAAETSD